MPVTPLGVLNEFLIYSWDRDKIEALVDRLVTDDAVYVSLNFSDPDLQRIIPWAGTKRGKQAFVDNFRGVTTRWIFEGFTTKDTVEQGENVAVFGEFSLRSVKLKQVVTSLVGVSAKVHEERITYFRTWKIHLPRLGLFEAAGHGLLRPT